MHTPRIFHGDRGEFVATFPKGLRWVEVGVGKGKFSQTILKRAEPSKLILVDLWRGQSRDVYEDAHNAPDYTQERRYQWVCDKFAKEIDAGVVEIHRGYSHEMLAALPEGSVDVVYVDANHTHDYVLADLRAGARVLAPNGFLSGHDYITADTYGYPCGVVSAVEQFLEENPNWTFAFVADVYSGFPTYLLTREENDE